MTTLEYRLGRCTSRIILTRQLYPRSVKVCCKIYHLNDFHLRIMARNEILLSSMHFFLSWITQIQSMIEEIKETFKERVKAHNWIDDKTTEYVFQKVGECSTLSHKFLAIYLLVFWTFGPSLLKQAFQVAYAPLSRGFSAI